VNVKIHVKIIAQKIVVNLFSCVICFFKKVYTTKQAPAN